MNPHSSDITDAHIALRLWRLLAGTLVALALGGALALGWMAGAQNRMAARDAEEILQFGLHDMRERAAAIVLDYSLWDTAYEAILAGDAPAVYDMVGASASEGGVMDALAVITVGEMRNYGWAHGVTEGQEPLPSLLPPEIAARARGAAREAGLGAAAHFFARWRGAVWLFSVAAVHPHDQTPEGESAEAYPLQVHGRLFDEERLRVFGEHFKLEGVAFSPDRGDEGAIPLIEDPLAPVFLVWRQPRPGDAALIVTAPPLLAAFVIVGLAAWLVARGIRRAELALEAALAEAERANAAKSTFLANISHELRTPMNGVLGVAQVLRDSKLDDRQSHLVGVLLNSARAQMKLIEQLLDYTTLEAGARVRRIEAFSPGEELEIVRDRVSVEAARKGLSLHLDCDGACKALLRGDRRAFATICGNLVDNAVKYTTSGCVCVKLRIRRDDDAYALSVEVEDTGPGLAEDQQPRIFQSFDRIEDADMVGGAGLGLATAHALAESLGGVLSVRSAPGQGAVFRFEGRFAVADEAPAA